MPALQVVRLVGAVLVLALFSPGIAVSHAAPRPALAAHRLPTDPHSPAFRFGVMGGFSTVGSFTVTIYVDGRVTLKKHQPHSPLHLLTPGGKVYPIALTALLTLAQAERFFSMPARIAPRHPVSDLGSAFVSIYTTSGVKTVTVLGVTLRPFYELYTLLNYVAGATT